MDWFISDFHIDDERMLSRRHNFKSLEEMEIVLINNFNSLVKDEDTVWLLGDIVATKEDAMRVIAKLNGKKNYIIGNHDRKWVYDKDVKTLFNSIQEMSIIEIDDIPITLCHYPMYEWYKSKYGGVLIHGHMHDEKISDEFYLTHCAVDVSVEKTNYFPISWEDIKFKVVKEGKQLYIKRKNERSNKK